MKKIMLFPILLVVCATHSMHKKMELANAKKTISDLRAKEIGTMNIDDYYSIIKSARIVLHHDKYNYPYTLILEKYKKEIAAFLENRIKSSQSTINERVALLDEMKKHDRSDSEFKPLLESRDLLVNLTFWNNKLETLETEHLSAQEKYNQKLMCHQEIAQLLATASESLPSVFEEYRQNHQLGLIELRSNIQKADYDRITVLKQLVHATKLLKKTYAPESSERTQESLNQERLNLKIRLQKLHDNTQLSKIDRYICEIPLRKELRDTYPTHSEKYAEHGIRIATLKSYINKHSLDATQQDAIS